MYRPGLLLGQAGCARKDDRRDEAKADSDHDRLRQTREGSPVLQRNQYVEIRQDKSEQQRDSPEYTGINGPRIIFLSDMQIEASGLRCPRRVSMLCLTLSTVPFAETYTLPIRMLLAQATGSQL
jgi:hypothetical protein